MSENKNLLVELFVEELPPKALKKLGEVFSQTLAATLKAQGLCGNASVTTSFASPRRLAAHVTAVLAQAPEKKVRTKLMPVNIGIDTSGQPSPALVKKMQAFGVEPSVLGHLALALQHDSKQQIRARLEEASGPKLEIALALGKDPETLYYNATEAGATLSEGLQKAIEAALAALPIPKVMTYQLADGWSTVNFVRPAHGLVALYGADVVPVSVLGLKAGRATHGHRFEASVDPIVLKDADCYAAQLETEGAVIASFAARREEIAHQLKDAAAKAGGTPIKDEALLDEVTALVERPNVLIGQFEEAFLEVPQECLILTMKANQKYFPLLDGTGKLTNKFLIVSNIRPSDPGDVIGGNERVVRPRLADAKFFFDQDRKKPLEARVLGLAKVVYHNKLGTQGERTQRVCAIARAIGLKLGGEALSNKADQAALLAKADLLTDMVGEFPELQGIMGRYYALHDGLPAEVADAIEDHYKPRFAGDSLPRGLVGMVAALADKLETLVGMFGIGQAPTGDRDPFALRRHALGVIRMLIERNVQLSLDRLFEVTTTPFRSIGGDFKFQFGQLSDFIYERLTSLLREQGYSIQEIDAVVSLRPQYLGDIPKRLAAVRAFAALPEAASLAAANKRVGNILKKVEGEIATQVDENLLNETAEVALYWSLGEVRQRADIAFDAGDYTGSLKSLAALKVSVDAFFTDVMVNVEDDKLRNNRLALLVNLHAAMNRIADISKL